MGLVDTDPPRGFRPHHLNWILYQENFININLEENISYEQTNYRSTKRSTIY